MQFPKSLFARDQWKSYLRFKDINAAREWLYNEATEAEGQEFESFCYFICDNAEALLPAWAVYIEELETQNNFEEAARFRTLFEFTSPVMASSGA